jgi:hypothetical protein
MRLTLKHVERTKSGSWQYRRRVPKDVSSVIPKREFKQKLGDSEREALAAWPRVHALVEREISTALKRIALGLEATQGNATGRLAYVEAKRRLAELLALGASSDELEIVADELSANYPMDPENDTPIGASQVDKFTINLLRLGDEP